MPLFAHNRYGAVSYTHLKQFELPFEYKKAIDESALKEGKYKLAFVFSSSINGAEFKGSVGRTLWIDEVTIQCKEDNE